MSPVAILGPGLIGGSLGLALQRHSPNVEVRVWSRRDSSLDAIRQLKFARIVDTDLATVVSGAGCVVLCTPIEIMADLSQRMRDILDPFTTVTDAGSVKSNVVAECTSILGKRFVGAHPIAGSDRTGIDAAEPNLYQGATCVLTPTSQTEPMALETVRHLWRSVGCHLVEMLPEAHDAILARTSHLPHVIASALVHVVARTGPGWEKLVGGGYRDTTRIAQGNPDLWTGILMANRAEISTSIAEMDKILQNIRLALETNDEKAIRALLTEGQASRQKLNVF